MATSSRSAKHSYPARIAIAQQRGHPATFTEPSAQPLGAPRWPAPLFSPRPLAISRQNHRSPSRRCDGLPGDFIAERPVNSFVHPAGLPIATLQIEVLRRPRESAQYVSLGFGQKARDAGIAVSMGSKGDCYDCDDVDAVVLV